MLWLSKDTGRVEAAFEVEHSTSIYSGIVRMLDLAFGVPEEPIRGRFLVAPDQREEEVRTQLRRPAFQRIQNLELRYLPHGELERNREQMVRFGSGLRPIEAIARRLGSPRRTSLQTRVDDAAAALVVLLFATVLAVYKPRGVTPYAHQKQPRGA